MWHRCRVADPCWGRWPVSRPWRRCVFRRALHVFMFVSSVLVLHYVWLMALGDRGPAVDLPPVGDIKGRSLMEVSSGQKDMAEKKMAVSELKMYPQKEVVAKKLRDEALVLRELPGNPISKLGTTQRPIVTPGPVTSLQFETVTFRLEDSLAFTFKLDVTSARGVPQNKTVTPMLPANSGRISSLFRGQQLVSTTRQYKETMSEKVLSTDSHVHQPPLNKVLTSASELLQIPRDELLNTRSKVPKPPLDEVLTAGSKVLKLPLANFLNAESKVPKHSLKKVFNTEPSGHRPNNYFTSTPLAQKFLPSMSKVHSDRPDMDHPPVSPFFRSRIVRMFKQISTSPNFHKGETPLQVSVTQVTKRDRLGMTDESITCHVRDSIDYDWSDANLSLRRDLCPKRPATTIGRFTPVTSTQPYDQLIAMFVGMQDGGHYTPRMCTPIEKTAIIIPYRNRCRHLYTLLPNLIPMLMRQNVDFTIFVVEQSNRGTFNKGILFNAGYLEALKLDNYDCFILHDVDMIPVDDRNMYRCNAQGPIHFSSAVNKFNYRNLYEDLFGGVVGFTRDQFKFINGASNLYFGWGAEDDDLRNRVVSKNLTLWRRTPRYGVYDMINHTSQSDVGWEPNPDRYKVYGSGRARQNIDGINSLTYKLTWLRTTALYTWLGISFDKNFILSTVPKKLRMGRLFNESYLPAKFKILY